MKNKHKINSLTSLRFFALFLVILLHITPLFHKTDWLLNNFALHQGVSFFFILSGFVLAMNYDNFKTKKEVINFYLKRLIRLYPVYIFCLFIMIVAFPRYMPGEHKILITLSQLFMIQAWIPLKSFYSSYNAASWTVSTLFFLYLIFPFIIQNWKKTWYLKLLLFAMLPFLLIFLSNKLQLTYPGPDTGYTNLKELNVESLNYINPLDRIFEFFLGILGFKIFIFLKQKFKKTNFLVISILEIITLFLVISGFYMSRMIMTYNVFSNATNLYILGSGSAIFLMLFIIIVSFERGFIAKILTWRFFIYLGTISYSMYLFHDILMRYYSLYLKKIYDYKSIVFFISYFVFLIIGTVIVFDIVEKLGGKILKYIIAKKFLNIELNKRTIVELIILAFFLGYFIFYQPNKSFKITSNLSKSKKYNQKNLGTTDTLFYNKLHLYSFETNVDGNNIKIKLYFNVLKFHRLQYQLAVHFLNNKSNIIGQADHDFDNTWSWVYPGEKIVHEFEVNKELWMKAKSVGMKFYENKPPKYPQLSTKGKNVDTNNRFILFLKK